MLASGCLWAAGEDVGCAQVWLPGYCKEGPAPLFGSERLTLTERRGKLRIELKPEAGAAGAGRRHSVTVVVAAVGSISLLALGGLTAVPASAASGAPAVSQCNPPDFPTGAGYQVTCTVSVENYTTSTGATSSTVTTSACLAAAGVVFPSCPLNLGPVTSTTTSTQLVTSVNQCNGIVNGAGSNVYCNVTVTDNIPGRNVHVGCHGGSVRRLGRREHRGSAPPLGSTTNATVTQCNGSANGGGTYAGEPAAGCTVTGTDSALPVTINQCNGTSNGGGSAVTCMATIADVFVPASTSHDTDRTGAASGTGGTAAAGGTTAAGGLAGGSGGVGWSRRVDRYSERSRRCDRHRCVGHSDGSPANWIRRRLSLDEPSPRVRGRRRARRQRDSRWSWPFVAGAHRWFASRQNHLS